MNKKLTFLSILAISFMANSLFSMEEKYQPQTIQTPDENPTFIPAEDLKKLGNSPLLERLRKSPELLDEFKKTLIFEQLIYKCIDKQLEESLIDHKCIFCKKHYYNDHKLLDYQLECGHKICSNCQKQIFQTDPSIIVCPLCKTISNDMIKIYSNKTDIFEKISSQED